MLGLNETIDQLAMENSVRWHGVEERGWSLDFEVESQRKKERPKRTWQKQVEEEFVKIGLRKEDELCRAKLSVGINQIADN